ncbi:hypothetical protein B0H14DRAFT_2627675 [Mycena olivaceomarginata]|nr:hypothetical protein B0H14DRAFT_2627675 [Mycena olivaceomarginata]
MQRIVTRAARRHSYRQGHDEVGDAITAAQQSLSTLTDEKKAVTALLKDLKAQHKELGRVPRNTTSGRNAHTGSSIPRLVASTMDVKNETPESDVEQALSPLLPSSSPVSSPGPLLRPLDDDSEMFPATISVDVPEASSDPSGFPLQSDASASAPSATFSDLSTSFDLSFDLSPGDIDFINDFDFTTLAIPLGTHDSFDATQTGSSSAPSSTMPSDWPAKSYGGNWKRPTGALRMTPTVGEERRLRGIVSSLMAHAAASHVKPVGTEAQEEKEPCTSPGLSEKRPSVAMHRAPRRAAMIPPSTTQHSTWYWVPASLQFHTEDACNFWSPNLWQQLARSAVASEMNLLGSDAARERKRARCRTDTRIVLFKASFNLGFGVIKTAGYFRCRLERHRGLIDRPTKYRNQPMAG